MRQNYKCHIGLKKIKNYADYNIFSALRRELKQSFRLDYTEYIDIIGNPFASRYRSPLVLLLIVRKIKEPS